MPQKRLLLLSNSTTYGMGCLEHAKPGIKDSPGDTVKKVLFVPYAGVRFSFDDYASKVRERFQETGYNLESIHETYDPRQAVENAEAIAVGGGNTFHLLYHLYRAEVNPDIYVVGLREGSILRIEGETIELLGEKTARIFKDGSEPNEIKAAGSWQFRGDKIVAAKM